jgi:hypothetical protein
VRSYFTFPELVKVISVHHAHRLLSESTLILCTLGQRPMKHVPEHEQLRGRDDGHLAALTPCLTKLGMIDESADCRDDRASQP